MRSINLILFLLMAFGVGVGVAPGLAQVQPDAKLRREQISAATGNAVASLREQISELSLARKLSVGEFLDRTDSQEALTKTLQRAEEIGGPRWVDDQTCQVRLEISGQRIADLLTQIAAVNPKTAPLPAQVVAVRVKDIQNRRFAAIGSSTGGASAQDIRPTDRDALWSGISDEERRQGVLAAKRNAMARVLDAVRPIPLADHSTVGDALAVPQVQRDVDHWLNDRPVTRVEFRDERRVDLTLAVDADGFFDVFKTAAQKQTAVAVPLDDTSWERVRHDFEHRMPEATGHGRAPVIEGSVSATTTAGTTSMPAAMFAPAGAARASDAGLIQIPSHAPNWASRPIEVEGTSEFASSRLKTARVAERAARQRLRTIVESLPLDGRQTLGDAARHDPRLRDAISHAVRGAEILKTEYRGDDSVSVRLSCDTQDLWNELTERR